MKVLFVTTNDYPNNGTCAHIINNLINFGGLLTKDCSFDILSSKSHFDDNDEIIVDDVKIIKVFSWTLLSRSVFKNEIIKHFSFKGFCYRLALYIQNRFLRSCYADYGTKNAFYNTLKRIGKYYDLIISISGRYDASLAVLKYCRNNDTPFVLYQVDPLGTNKSYSVASRNRRIRDEQLLYKYATFVFTTPIIFGEHISDNKFSLYEKKTTQLEFPNVIPKIIPNRNSNEKKRCMFLGTFYKGIRSPNYLLSLFEDLLRNDEVVLEFVGVTDDILDDNYKDLPIICHGRKGIDECEKLMNSSDFLINIGNTIDNQIPSKIFDYISTGKPIINVCAISNCPTIDYLKKYPRAINIIENNEDIEVQKKELKKFIFGNDNLVLSENDINVMFEKCTPKYVAKIISDVIRDYHK